MGIIQHRVQCLSSVEQIQSELSTSHFVLIVTWKPTRRCCDNRIFQGRRIVHPDMGLGERGG